MKYIWNVLTTIGRIVVQVYICLWVKYLWFVLPITANGKHIFHECVAMSVRLGQSHKQISLLSFSLMRAFSFSKSRLQISRKQVLIMQRERAIVCLVNIYNFLVRKSCFVYSVNPIMQTFQWSPTYLEVATCGKVYGFQQNTQANLSLVAVWYFLA